MSRRSLLPVLVVAVLSAGAAPTTSSSGAAADEPPSAPDQLLVGYEIGASPNERAHARAGANARFLETVVDGDHDTAEVELVRISPSDRSRADRRFEANPNVAYAEPNWVLTPAHHTTPLDTYFHSGQLWGTYGDASAPMNAYGSQAAEAWAAGNTGSRDVYIGIIDTGVMHQHEDLDDGRIDTGNSYDFFYDDATIYDGPDDDHGTHVAGTIGAETGNGIGVAGVNWDVGLVVGKFLGPSGGYTSGAIRAVEHMTHLKQEFADGEADGVPGRNIVATNNSWGGGGYSQGLHDAIIRGAKADILFIAAAGNSSQNNDKGRGRYPSNYDTTVRTETQTAASYDAVISVAAITSSGDLASWSNYGASTVDLGAPGSGIWSTVPGGYGSYSGTSMATPHVSGGAALYKAANPSASAAEIRDAILSSAVPTDSLSGKTVTGGRLDLSAFVPTSSIGNTPPAATTTSETTSEDTAVTFALGGSDLESCELTFSITDGPSHGVLSALTDNACTGGGPYADSAAVTYTPAANHDASDSFTYRVSDGGMSDDSTVTVTVESVNDPPTASFTYSCVSLTCTFDGTASSDPDEDLLSYAWTFADGSSATGVTASHTYDAGGTYQVGLTASDGTVSGSTSQIVTVPVESAPDPSTTLVVASETYSHFGGKFSDQHLDVTILITDGSNPVSGVEVSIGLYRGGSRIAASSATTGSDGTVTFGYRGVGSGCYEADVTTVAKSDHSWDGTEPSLPSCK